MIFMDVAHLYGNELGDAENRHSPGTEHLVWRYTLNFAD
jgi:hypothetical protein